MREMWWVAIMLVGLASADYWEDRAQFIQDERNMFLGSEIQLNENEVAANEILMEAKTREYVGAFNSVENIFPPARHFFESKQDIEQSDVFKFIQKMPKGAMLHGHDMALGSTEYLLKNLTYRDNLFACVDAEDYFRLRFFQTPDATCNWTLVSVLRESSGDVDAFDAMLEKKLTLVVPNPKETYPDINAIWTAFNKLFVTAFSLLTYRPVFEDYFYQILTEFYEDNVMYIEFRATMEGVYELDGTFVTILETATIYNNVMQRFAQDHPGFIAGRVIYAPSRKVDNATVLNYLEVFRTLKGALPNFVAGFDLVGQEDVGQPLSELIGPLLEFKAEGANLFFHAGETNWQGETDINLIDAILLNTTRIGHGYALNKHPLALSLVKERGIAIEVNPLSNQVLMLVEDLRNHPAAALMADNYPVVISCDDPSFWGAKGLSYDFYAAFMGLSGLHADLRTLKQLAINSIQYSAMPAGEKESALEAWEIKWNAFINEILEKATNRILSPSRTTASDPSRLKNTVRIELV